MWSKITDKMKQHANMLFERGRRIICHKTALLEREEAETMEALEEKCIQSNSALCASQTELKQLQKQ